MPFDLLSTPVTGIHRVTYDNLRQALPPGGHDLTTLRTGRACLQRADSLVCGGQEQPFGQLEAHQTVAKASVRLDYIDFGSGYCNLPPKLNRQIVADMQQHPGEFTALVQINPHGCASLLGCRVQDCVYKF
ncbi:MAG TPA: hypothetical protein EYG11_08510 [Candidatus Latescibacteria bacterium]|nr:hypothetical protein [Candidatus Handelsmanbacteria bacterium]HIL08727.1 hypothetical protein [Candidatus Latescibacterota bacterium]